MKTCRPMLALIVLVLSRAALAADTAGVALDAPDGLPEARGMQVLAIQALQDAGMDVVDAVPLQGIVAPAALLDAASAAGVERLFVLHLAPLRDATIAMLEEVIPSSGACIYRASLTIDTDADADRVLGRLAAAVVARAPVDDGARIETVTEHEGRPYAKRPGEFLWGIGIFAGLLPSVDDEVAWLYGGQLRFLYELPNWNFGVTLGGGGSEDGGLGELTVRANYLFIDGDVSPYVGLGFGISGLGVDSLDGQFGAHAVVSAGVELFRLHATRLVAGVDVMLPMYRLESYDWDDGVSEARYTPFTALTVGVLW